MLWFITTLRFNRSEKTIYQDWLKEEFSLDRRTVGFFSSKEKAIEAVEGNWGDLNEAGWYPWLVIEGLKPNCIYPLVTKAGNQIFFEWQGKDDGKWVSCDFPKEVEDHYNKFSYLKQFCEIS